MSLRHTPFSADNFGRVNLVRLIVGQVLIACALGFALLAFAR